jgi:iron(III) transport system ATP-binding protein
MFMADKVALMRAGRLVQLGRPTDLYFAPVNAFVASFFGEINHLQGVIRDGRVTTPFGEVVTPQLPEGTAVEILIRPEALRLQPVGGDPGADLGTAKVMAARMLGRSSLVHLSVNGGEGDDLHLHARIPGRFLPAEDEVLAVHLDRSQAFVFPLDDAT